MNIRLTIILLVIATILGGWYFSQQHQHKENHDLADLIKREGSPEYVGQQISTMVYDLKGKPQYFAKAQEIKRFETTERTEFLKPLLDLFDTEKQLKQWQVTADIAEITKDKMLHLKGNVRIENVEPNSRLSFIETEELSINLATYDISSDSVVKSQGMGFTTTGTGLTGNLKKQVATLTKDVKTYLEPTIIQKTKKQAEPSSNAAQ